MTKKAGKLEKELKKGNIFTKKVEWGKDHSQYIAQDARIISRIYFQKVLDEIPNHYVTGLEGFFALESSIDDDLENILNAGKNRELAEMFIQDFKEGADLWPIWYWSKHAVIGYVLIVFLTKVLVSLTQLFCKNPVVKNLKGLKKYLTNLTLTIVYPAFGYAIIIISNYSQELPPILGYFVKRYGTLEAPNLRKIASGELGLFV